MKMTLTPPNKSFETNPNNCAAINDQNPETMNRKTIPFGISLALGIFFVSCELRQAPAEDPATAIRATWDAFIAAWEIQDAAACAAFYAENGVNIPPGFSANQGWDAIQEFYQFLFDNNRSSRYTHTIRSISFADNMALELGAFRVDWINNEGYPWIYSARSITHWEQNEAGQWRIKALLFNEAPPEE
jgi:uncharacterized protein (TIGR02246 family)